LTISKAKVKNQKQAFHHTKKENIIPSFIKILKKSKITKLAVSSLIIKTNFKLKETPSLSNARMKSTNNENRYKGINNKKYQKLQRREVVTNIKKST
jgi:hypothetical protein